MPQAVTLYGGATSAQRVFAVNSTATSFPATTRLTSAPGGDGHIQWSLREAELAIRPFGNGAANENFLLRLDAMVLGSDGVWIATPFFTALCTLGTLAGSAGANVTDTDLYADTVDKHTGTLAINSYRLLSEAANTIATLLVTPPPCNIIRVSVDLDGGGSAADGANAEWWSYKN